MGEVVKLAKVKALAETGALPEDPVPDFSKYKLELVLNYCANIQDYIMFKSRGVSVALHPVTGRLVQYRQLIDRLEEMDTIVMLQVEVVLLRTAKGESVEQIVKEERRNGRMELERKKQKPLKLGKQTEPAEDETESKKRKAESEGLSGLEGLT